MPQIPEEQFRKLESQFTAEIEEIEERVASLTERLTDLRDKQQALRKLLGVAAPGAQTSADDNHDGDYAPTDAYWVPLLESVEELGGRAAASDVLDRMERRLSGVLRPADYELLPSGLSVRWRNRAQWQRKNMVMQGLLSRNSPHGIWEITPEGRAWLAQRRKRP
jgi:hypothetical protein